MSENVPEAMKPLLKFLKDHEDDSVWLLIAPGFISCTIDHAPDNHLEVFTVRGVRLYLQNNTPKLDQVLLSTSQIYAWGVGAVPGHEKFYG